MGDETQRERQRMFFSSREGQSWAPRLIVDYTYQVDNQPPQAKVNPLPQWSRSRFTVSWGGYDPGGSGIDYFDVQYRRAGYAWNNWLMYTRQGSAEFTGGANGTLYEFRARAVDNAGNVQPWSAQAQASTTVDAAVPYSNMNALPPILFSPATTVSWYGSDPGGSGIATYDVQFQENNGPWIDWQMGTPATSYYATGGQDGVTYGFRVRATDKVGNVEPWSPVAQTQTTVSTQGPAAEVLTFVPDKTDEDEFLVRWTAQTAPGTSIEHYNVQYRFEDGAWISWQTATKGEQALFAIPNEEDGRYCFEAQAKDSEGREGDWSPERCMRVDRYPPFFEIRGFFPTVAKAIEFGPSQE
jgi:hypothetical protein